jgi:uncharacterized protein YjiS (DUF1127 family)
MDAIDRTARSKGDDPMAYTQANTYPYRRQAPRRGATGLGGLAARAIGLFLSWQERARGRKELGQLDDRMLKDIGLNRIDALRETDKPFWRS